MSRKCKKIKYITGTQAKTSARVLSKKYGYQMYDYYCLRCGTWHLTSMSPDEYYNQK